MRKVIRLAESELKDMMETSVKRALLHEKVNKENVLNDEQLTEPELKRNQKQRNGMWSKHHRPESKAAISATQKARYDLLRIAVDRAMNPISDERIMQIVQEIVTDYIKNNSTPVNNRNNKKDYDEGRKH